MYTHKVQLFEKAQRKLCLIGPLRTRDPLIAYRQVSVGENRCRYAASVCASDGCILVTFVAVTSPRSTSNCELLRSRGHFHLNSLNRQVNVIFRPGAEIISQYACAWWLWWRRGGPGACFWRRKQYFGCVLKSFSYVAAHLAQLSDSSGWTGGAGTAAFQQCGHRRNDRHSAVGFIKVWGTISGSDK